MRQTTKVFFTSKNLAEYDELLNRAWAGQISLRYEERTPLPKDGEVMILVCYFEALHPEPRAAAPGDGEQEPEVKAHRIP